MKYISDDGKVFNTEQECCEYEQKFLNLEKKRKELRDKICSTYSELKNLVSKYTNSFGIKNPIYFASWAELSWMLDDITK